MLKMYEFLCPSHHLTEELVDSGVKAIPCPECGCPAKRVLSATPGWVILDPRENSIRMKKRADDHAKTPRVQEKARYQYEKAMGKVAKKFGD